MFVCPHNHQVRFHRKQPPFLKHEIVVFTEKYPVIIKQSMLRIFVTNQVTNILLLYVNQH